MTDVITRQATLSLAEKTAADGVRFILATFVDMNGKPCAKLVPIEALADLEAGALGFAGFAAGAIGQKPQDPDICVIPDPDSYANLDFIKPGLAMVQCDPYVNGEPWPYAPRVILKRVLDELAQTKGMTAMVGAEIEYFLLARDADGSIHPADTRDESGQPCYDARGVTRMYEHLSTTSKAMNDLGWGNYANDHEDGNGQFEQNFTFADALTTADRVITLRYIISMVAEAQGMTATFMPKPFANRSGNGMHLHLSLWGDGEPLFPNDADGHGLGLSKLAYNFIGGILDHAPALQAFIAPSVNSYKRSGARSTLSGATWSPRLGDFGGNDRTHFIRVPDGNRIELRGGDGSANPYLAIAAALVAGVEGIDSEIDPGAPNGPGVPGANAKPLPPTLLHAVAELRADQLLNDTFGADVTGYFADVKEEEFITWHNTVTPWEIDRYLTAF